MSAPLPEPPLSGISTAEAVFEALLADIVRGVYPPRGRLPAERDLARLLGTSRPTLREALGRLGDWGLIESRRGSGVVVRDRREWSVEVLPAFLHHGTAGLGPGARLGLLRDLLSLRRGVTVEILRLIAERIDPARVEGLDAAREAAEQAWELRERAADFIAADFRAFRALAEAADFLPAVWMLNRFAGMYLDIAVSLSEGFRPADDYLEIHEKILACLGRGDADSAAALLTRLQERDDARLLAALGEAS